MCLNKTKVQLMEIHANCILKVYFVILKVKRWGGNGSDLC